MNNAIYYFKDDTIHKKQCVNKNAYCMQKTKVTMIILLQTQSAT